MVTARVSSTCSRIRGRPGATLSKRDRKRPQPTSAAAAPRSKSDKRAMKLRGHELRTIAEQAAANFHKCPMGQRQGLIIDGAVLRRYFRDNEAVGPVDEQILTVNAHRKQD